MMSKKMVRVISIVVVAVMAATVVIGSVAMLLQ